LTARVTDNLGGAMTSVAVNVTVHAAEAKLYYIHVDHLNTPRLIQDQAGTTVWRRDNQEPFGDSPPDENPSGLGAFELPLRFAGQYFDKETNIGYNMARDYDAAIGRYVQSDPIGLRSGINSYAYVEDNPLSSIDPSGLQAARCRRTLGAEPGGELYGVVTQHSYSCVRYGAQWVCGGQGPSGNPLGSPGQATSSSTDYYVESACKPVPDSNQCFENCLREEWDESRPYYSIVPLFGSQCHQYDNELHRRCEVKCGMK